MYQWAVLGAGPAGIIAVSYLLRLKVPAKQILWIDPAFEVGQFGTTWSQVWSNTATSVFKTCIESLNSFGNMPDFELNHISDETYCRLNVLAEPLAWLSKQCQQSVPTQVDTVNQITLSRGAWSLELTDETVCQSKRVILATGSHPKVLDLPCDQIKLEVALNDQLLSQMSLSKETVGVFGSSHSAILAIENLLNAGAKRVINFYKSPIKYALAYEDFILFDNTGLKKHTAAWAKKNIDGVWPANLQRVLCPQVDAPPEWLSLCTQVVYAIGFERTQSVQVTHQANPISYNAHNGIIAPGLFGLGVAYPEKWVDPFGYAEYHVGVFKFFKHMKRCFPIWQRYTV